MDFSRSRLPDNALVKEAFHYSYAALAPLRREAMQGYNEQIDFMRGQGLEDLDRKKKEGMGDEEFKLNKEAFEKFIDMQKKRGAKLVADEVDRQFLLKRVGPARELADHSDAASPALMAAVMLADGVRSPVDYKNIEKKFGEPIAGIVAEIVHIDSYPSDRAANLQAATPDIKRAYMALMIASFEQLADQVERTKILDPGHIFALPDGQEAVQFKAAQALWGVDKKLEQRFVDSFNKAGGQLGSPFKMEIDADGKPELVKDFAGKKPPVPPFTPPPPKGPSGPGGDGSIGGDVF